MSNIRELSEIRTYGCTKQQMIEATQESIKTRFGGDQYRYGLHLLKLAVEEIESGLADDGRQTLNRGIYVSESMNGPKKTA